MKLFQEKESDKWIIAMKDELKSMQHNQVCELTNLPEGFKPIGCKLIYKTKKDSNGKIDRNKANLLLNGSCIEHVLFISRLLHLFLQRILLGL